MVLEYIPETTEQLGENCWEEWAEEVAKTNAELAESKYPAGGERKRKEQAVAIKLPPFPLPDFYLGFSKTIH